MARTVAAPSASTRSGRAPVDPDRLDAWRDFLRAHAVVTAALSRELEAARDLPLAQYDVLVQLDQAPDRRLRMQELASRVLFSRSGLTRLVDRMVREGLVARERCEDDRRGTYAVLTTVGRRRLRDAAGVHLRGVDEHFTRHLTDADVRALRAALAGVLDAEDPGTPDGAPDAA
jgi:DNA-binding MarR family transcriptional regulator